MQDNRDAEAFLKPVAKSEVPDYCDSTYGSRARMCSYSSLLVISNPMDLQTMLRRVKQRHYKSKKEFKDDLDLIWDNCFTYNATPVSRLHVVPSPYLSMSCRTTPSGSVLYGSKLKRSDYCRILQTTRSAPTLLSLGRYPSAASLA